MSTERQPHIKDDKHSRLYGGLSADTKIRFKTNSELGKTFKKKKEDYFGFDKRDGWVPGYMSLHRKNIKQGNNIIMNNLELIDSTRSKNF